MNKVILPVKYLYIMLCTAKKKWAHGTYLFHPDVSEEGGQYLIHKTQMYSEQDRLYGEQFWKGKTELLDLSTVHLLLKQVPEIGVRCLQKKNRIKMKSYTMKQRLLTIKNNMNNQNYIQSWKILLLLFKIIKREQ